MIAFGHACIGVISNGQKAAVFSMVAMSKRLFFHTRENSKVEGGYNVCSYSS